MRLINYDISEIGKVVGAGTVGMISQKVPWLEKALLNWTLADCLTTLTIVYVATKIYFVIKNKGRIPE